MYFFNCTLVSLKFIILKKTARSQCSYILQMKVTGRVTLLRNWKAYYQQGCRNNRRKIFLLEEERVWQGELTGKIFCLLHTHTPPLKKKKRFLFAVPLEGYWTVKWDIVNGHGIGYCARPFQENQAIYLYGLPPLRGQNISPAGWAECRQNWNDLFGKKWFRLIIAIVPKKKKKKEWK